MIREISKYEVVKKLNLISAMKTFKKRTCKLCMVERREIQKMSKKDPEHLINYSSEIYGACRHNPNFHRYKKLAVSTDELGKSEKVNSVTQDSFHSQMWCVPCGNDNVNEMRSRGSRARPFSSNRNVK